jgi:inosine triphosphate pyrophosphatase
MIPHPSPPPPPKPQTLTFITSNQNKLSEARSMLGGVVGVSLQSRSLQLVEIQGSVEEIARDKCSRAAEMVCMYVRVYLDVGGGDFYRFSL